MHWFSLARTGDLAYKKIFPALQEMIQRGTLAVTVIGVAKSGWNFAAAAGRALGTASSSTVESDPVAFPRLISLLKYVDGDYSDPATFRALRAALGTSTFSQRTISPFLMRSSEPSSNNL